MIYDCPISDVRTSSPPQGQLATIFAQEWQAGRKKEGSTNYKGEHTFRLPIDDHRLSLMMRRAIASALKHGHDLDAVYLNWETLPAVPSRDVPLSWRYDDAFALADTIDLLRDEAADKLKIVMYGLRPWTMHRNYVDPAHLWEIYSSCGVELDGVAVSAIRLSPKAAYTMIESKLIEMEKCGVDTSLVVMLKESNPEMEKVIESFKLDTIYWYRTE
jgi:hypothetical protein